MFSSPWRFIAAATAVATTAIIVFEGSAAQPRHRKTPHKLEQPSWVDVTDFYQLVVNDLFVDKSLMIKSFFSAGEIIRILMPSGWAKTTNVDMLKRFLEIETDERGEPLPPDKRINVKLFAGGAIVDGNRTVQLKPLNISLVKSIMDVQGSYPVIRINLGNVTGVTYEEIESKLKLAVAELFAERRSYLRPKSSGEAKTYDSLCEAKASERDFELSLLFLSHLLHKRYGRRVFVLIDDYDVPTVNLFLNEALRLVDSTKNKEDTSAVIHRKTEEAVEKAANSATLRKTERLLRRVLGNCLLHNDALNQGLLTGIFYVPLNDYEMNTTTMDTTTRYNVLDNEFQPWYGIYQDEVEELLRRLVTLEKQPDILVVRQWYVHNARGHEMYNSRSIRRFLANGAKLGEYWSDRKTTLLAPFVLSTKPAQHLTQGLCDGEFATSRIEEKVRYRDVCADATVLFYSGYVSVAIYGYGEDAEIIAANREMKKAVAAKMVAWICENVPGVTSNTFSSLAEDLALFKVTDFQAKLRKILTAFPTAAPDESEEWVYYGGVMKSITQFFGPQYVVNANVPPSWPQQSVSISAVATNRRKNAIILDYRLVNNTEDRDRLLREDFAFMCSEKCDVNRELHPYIEQVLKIAIVFYRKDFRMEYLVDRNVTIINPLRSQYSRVLAHYM